MMSVVAKWQLLSKKDSAGGGTTGKAEGGAVNGSDALGNNNNNAVKQRGTLKPHGVSVSSTFFSTDADAAEVVLLKAVMLQVICLYQKVVPHLVSQCKFDFSKLLKGESKHSFGDGWL